MSSEDINSLGTKEFNDQGKVSHWPGAFFVLWVHSKLILTTLRW